MVLFIYYGIEVWENTKNTFYDQYDALHSFYLISSLGDSFDSNGVSKDVT